MHVDARVEAWVSLHLLPAVSPRKLVTLLRALGGPAEVLAASRATLSKLVPPETAAIVERGPDPSLRERTLEWLAADAHALIAWDDADYPQPLLTVADPPPALY